MQYTKTAPFFSEVINVWRFSLKCVFLWDNAIQLNEIIIFIFFSVSSLEEDPLYIAYADMMAKVNHSRQKCDRPLLSRILQVPVFRFRAVPKVKKRRKERRKHLR